MVFFVFVLVVVGWVVFIRVRLFCCLCGLFKSFLVVGRVCKFCPFCLLCIFLLFLFVFAPPFICLYFVLFILFELSLFGRAAI